MIQERSEHAAAAEIAYQPKPVLLNGNPATKCADQPPPSLHDVCLELRERVDTFLAQEPETPLLRDMQAQLRVSMGVVEEAFERYSYVFPSKTPHRDIILMATSTDRRRLRYHIMAEKTVCAMRLRPSRARPSHGHAIKPFATWPWGWRRSLWPAPNIVCVSTKQMLT